MWTDLEFIMVLVYTTLKYKNVLWYAAFSLVYKHNKTQYFSPTQLKSPYLFLKGNVLAREWAIIRPLYKPKTKKKIVYVTGKTKRILLCTMSIKTKCITMYTLVHK